MIIEQENCFEDKASQILKVEIARLEVVQAALADSELKALAEQIGDTIEHLDEVLYYIDEDWSEEND